MFRISVWSPLHSGFDEPEILRCSNPKICPVGAEVRQMGTNSQSTMPNLWENPFRTSGDLSWSHTRLALTSLDKYRPLSEGQSHLHQPSFKA